MLAVVHALLNKRGRSLRVKAATNNVFMRREVTSAIDFTDQYTLTRQNETGKRGREGERGRGREGEKEKGKGEEERERGERDRNGERERERGERGEGEGR